MALSSMTGFSRADGALEGTTWHWEVRTVNGRGLDVRMRLPNGYGVLEQPVREACARHLTRGNCTVTLAVQRQGGETVLRLDEAVFRQLLEAAERAGALASDRAAPPRLDGLLAIRGVLDYVEPEEDEAVLERRMAAMIASLEEALTALAETRRAEGAHLATAVLAQVEEIERLVAAAEAAPARSPEAIRARLAAQLERLLDAGAELDPARLYQEAALIATRADIAEELDRLRAHVAAARALLASGEAVGRKLDFLAQEFHREANTLCAKSGDRELTEIGLGLKSVIDQMREQVQNIE